MNNFGITLSDGTGYPNYTASLGESYDNIADGLWGIQQMYDAGKIPFVHIMFHPSRQPECTIQKIADGDYDHLIENYFMKYLSYTMAGGRVVFVYLPEMNGDWTIYGPTGHPTWTADPEAFKTAYRNFVEKGRSMGIEALWCWAPNNYGYGNLEDWYPGDEWVDIVGMSAYQWAGLYPGYEWKSVSKLLDPTVVEVRLFTKKPLVITQIASGLNDDRTPGFLDELVMYTKIENNIDGFIWFNIGEFALGTGTDWETQTAPLDSVPPEHWFFDC